MILQALNRYYDTLVHQGELERQGWQPVNVSYALRIDDEGQLIQVLPLLNEVERNKKKVFIPRKINLPLRQKKSSGILANFLCDNSSYIIGVDTKGKPERTLKCFEECKSLHNRILAEVDSVFARSLVRFFNTWNPAIARDNEILKPFLDELVDGANLIFVHTDGQFIHEDPKIQKAWDEYCANSSNDELRRCLVTGEMAPVARIHPNIAGVPGGQSSGTSLVSFNKRAFESYGHDDDQGLNAPVSVNAALAYSAALNYMIATQGHHFRLSDTMIVFWAENGGSEYAPCFAAMLGDDIEINDNDIYEALKNLSAGRHFMWNETDLDPDEKFYILGLAPNAARLSVRFFLQNTFGKFADNMRVHHERLQIAKPNYDQRRTLSFRHLLDETVNQKSIDKMPSPLLSGSLTRSVLMGLPYPVLLYEQVELRIRAEHQISRGKAAVIKAFLMKNTQNGNQYDQYEEVLSVDLNENTSYLPYLLGRLFATLEGLQKAANPGINATIKDRFFNAACATPGIVFPQLIKLAQAHLKKLGSGEKEGLRVFYDKMIGSIMMKIEKDYPARLNLYDQGIFQLGYYHQVQSLYAKKEDK